MLDREKRRHSQTIYDFCCFAQNVALYFRHFFYLDNGKPCVQFHCNYDLSPRRWQPTLNRYLQSYGAWSDRDYVYHEWLLLRNGVFVGDSDSTNSLSTNQTQHKKMLVLFSLFEIIKNTFYYAKPINVFPFKPFLFRFSVNSLDNHI